MKLENKIIKTTAVGVHNNTELQAYRGGSGLAFNVNRSPRSRIDSMKRSGPTNLRRSGGGAGPTGAQSLVLEPNRKSDRIFHNDSTYF